MRIEVDQTLCREYANCVLEAPDVFDIDESRGKAIVLVAKVDPAQHAEVRTAVAACPARAITLFD